MSASVTQSWRISGHFPGVAFPLWIAQRATLLKLNGWVKRCDAQSLAVEVSGHQVLIEALEAACSLGPKGVVVDSIETQSLPNAGCRSAFVVL